MSETETHVGKMKPMVVNGATVEERCEDACKRLGLTRDKYHDSWEECLSDEGYRKVYQHNGVIYEIIEDKRLDDEDIAEASRNADGTVNFVLSYYNGGASFDEALNSAMKDLKDES